jgi:hypothetical protein
MWGGARAGVCSPISPVLRGPFRSEDRSDNPLSPCRNRPAPPSSKPWVGGSIPSRRANLFMRFRGCPRLQAQRGHRECRCGCCGPPPTRAPEAPAERWATRAYASHSANPIRRIWPDLPRLNGDRTLPSRTPGPHANRRPGNGDGGARGAPLGREYRCPPHSRQTAAPAERSGAASRASARGQPVGGEPGGLEAGGGRNAARWARSGFRPDPA